MVEGADIVATSRRRGHSSLAGRVEPLDVTDRTAVAEAIGRIAPTHVVHLAGVAALSVAVANPDAAWSTNVGGTLNVAQAIVQRVPGCLLIHAGSGQVYGASAGSGLPMDETTLLAPTDTYTVSKAAADLALGAMARAGLNCLRFRPFNHIGPGQSEDFAVASFAAQIARIERGQGKAAIKVGNLEARRDFLDVRDVAAAYGLAVAQGEVLSSGTILNLASGTTHRIRDLLEGLLGLTTASIAVEIDPSRLRASDIPVFLGDARRAKMLLGWQPKFSLSRTLEDTLEAARRAVPSTSVTA